jgi:pimeloyl-ACP methyl ester carboxylesterase
MKVYFISGLGADERVFEQLTLPESLEVVHIHWPQIAKHETLETYCRKIAAMVDTTQEFAIVGLSFGGIVATELTKMLAPKTTIIISSVSTRRELPLSYKIVSALGIQKIVPRFLLNKVYPFTFWYFGVKDKTRKLLLRQIMAGTSTRFLKWAINEILIWKNDKRPQNLVHIHGTADRIFPLNNTRADIIIKGGGHLMVYDNAAEISNILKDKLV